MAAPNFIMAGAPKCGTTAMYTYLSEHPHVFMPDNKEPEYFSTDFPRYRNITEESEYLRLFAPARREQIAVGEASTHYLISQEAAENIRRFNPDMRIIVMIRNPVEMLPSLHSQYLLGFRETLHSFEDAWHAQDRRRDGESIPPHCLEPKFLQYRDHGLLGRRLQHLLDVFPREQVHIVLHDDLRADPAAVYRGILAFLGLEDDGRTEFQKVNVNKTFRAPAVAAFLKNPPFPFNHVKNGVKQALGLNKTGLAKSAYATLSRPEKRPALDPAFRLRLVDEFSEDRQTLETILERDLSAWAA